jgi:hypothetical protein
MNFQHDRFNFICGGSRSIDSYVCWPARKDKIDLILGSIACYFILATTKDRCNDYWLKAMS